MIDIVVLTRNGHVESDVLQAIRRQEFCTSVQIVVGKPQREDITVWATIVRARNHGKRLGKASFVMFVDDDVLLAPDCSRQLLEELVSRPELGAIGVNVLKELPTKHRHVGMGATLFRRSVSNRFSFRWEANRCECQCMCDDLRRHAIGIEYSRTARAEHIAIDKSFDTEPDHTDDIQVASNRRRPACVLAALDRNHLRGFLTRFVPSLRRSGNQESVRAVTYGMTRSDIRELASADVRVTNRPSNQQSPAVRRLFDLPELISDLSPETPVAHWDAADVLFQGRLDPLWQVAVRNPNKILVATESFRYGNAAVADEWVSTIRNPDILSKVTRLVHGMPIINAGFVAGTAGAFIAGLKDVGRIYPFVRSSDWGDQTALNAYCRSNPNGVVEVSNDWNYCMLGTNADEVTLHKGRFLRRNGGHLIPVVHGAARSLESYWRRYAPLSSVL